jgi:hypothetical protein
VAGPLLAVLRDHASMRNPRVDAYLDEAPGWQREIMVKVRHLLHEADPEIEETIKRSVQPYFVLQGNVAAFLKTKDHVNVFLYDGGLAPDPARIITSGHGNETGRTISIYEGEPINDRAMVEIFRSIIANNRAGGWRSLKKG